MIADVDDNSLGEADVPDGPRDIEGVWGFSTAAIEQLKADPKGEFFRCAPMPIDGASFEANYPSEVLNIWTSLNSASIRAYRISSV